MMHHRPLTRNLFMPDIIGSVGDVVRTLCNGKRQLEADRTGPERVANGISTLRVNHSELKVRVSVLEEGRKVVEAQVRAVVAETIADLTIKFSRSQAAAQTLPRLGEPARESNESNQ